MKSRNLFLCMLFLLLTLSVNSYANVYASHIEVSATEFSADGIAVMSISFILNEAADNGVDVKIYDSGNVLVRTISLLAGVKGINTVEWDGTDDSGNFVLVDKYTVEVIASDDGYTEWTKISDDTKTVMYSGKGIEVNKDPESPYFGRIYVANGAPGTSGNAGAFYNGDGIYMYTPDQDTINFSDASVDWSSSSNSPFKTTIGEDGSVYVCDYGHDWLWQFDPEISAASAKLILDDDNRVTDQWIAANWVHGSGADRQIYTADAHYATGQGIIMYAIGTNELMPDGDTGVLAVARPNNGYYQNDVEVASDGSIFFSQRRSAKGEILDKDGKPIDVKAAGEAYPLVKYPAYTGTTLTIDDTLWTVPMSYVGAEGIALDEARNRVAWGDYYSGKVYVHNATTGELLWTVESGRNRSMDLAFDAVGNLYQADNSSEYWTMISPPDGVNSYTTSALDTIAVYPPSVYEGKVVITEFTYNSEYYDNEWVELYNASDETIDIVGWSLRDNPDSHTPVVIPDSCDTELLPGEYFTIWTGGDGQDHGWPLHFDPDLNVAYDFGSSTDLTPIGFNNDGDVLNLWDATGSRVDLVDFQDEFAYPREQRWGTGATCELIDPLGDNNDPTNWMASWFYGGTPAAATVIDKPDYPNVMITEVMYNSAGTDFEYIELMNADDVTVDILGWWIMDDSPTHTKLPIPDTCDTELAPGDFFTILVAKGSDPGFVPDFDISPPTGDIGLNNDKDNIILFNAGDSMVTYMHYDDGSSSYAEFAHATAADGSGPSLELVDLMGDPYDPLNWQASINDGGTPGYLNITPAKLVSAEVTGETTVVIEYSEEVDSTTAVTLTNYVIDHEKGNPTAAVWTGNMVELTTSKIAWDTVYTVAVWNVEDLEGFAILDSSTITFKRESPDHEGPVALLANAMTDSTVIVKFDEEVDSTSAVVLTNYTIDNSIGNPTAVKWMGAEVELLIGAKLSFTSTYTVIVNNVIDMYDNLKTEPDTLAFVLKDYRGKIVVSEFTWNSEFYDNEWFELCNNSTDTIDILGWSFKDEPASHALLIIPDTCDTELAPGEFFTIYIYGEGEEKGWPLHFSPDLNRAIDYTDTTRNHIWNLNNGGGDILYMWDEAGRLVEEISYWPVETFNLQVKWGVGVTLERIDLSGSCSDPANWQASWYYGGSPGTANRIERPVYPKIVINEVMYNSADGNTEFVELKNLDNVAVDISGWWLRRDNPTMPKVGFTAGSVLQPGGLYTILIDSLFGQDLGFVPDMNYTDTSKINFSNSNDNVILFNDSDLMVTYMHYDDNAHSYMEFAHAVEADGGGKSLEYWDYRCENWEPMAWAASQDSGGTPGAENYIYDVVPPMVDSAMAVIGDTTVVVWFSEDVNYTTATNKNNYTIDNGIGNPLYILMEENDKVVLFLNPANPLAEGTNYVVTVTGVRDIEGNEIAENNTASFVGVANTGIHADDAMPKVFALHKNYPNPFNPITTINYDLPKEANVRIVIYDLMGREVRTLVNTHQRAGYQTIHWNALDNSGRQVSSGYYFYVMDSDNFHKTQKMLLLK